MTSDVLFYLNTDMISSVGYDIPSGMSSDMVSSIALDAVDNEF